MNNLRKELTEKEYVPVRSLDLEYPPQEVLLYFNNHTTSNVRVMFEFVDPLNQVILDNQNPTLVMDAIGETLFCLSAVLPEEFFVPEVTINLVSDFVNPEFPSLLTVTGFVSSKEGFSTNEVLVTYYTETKTATLLSGNRWTVSFDLRETMSNATEALFAKANVVNDITGTVGELSPTVDTVFEIIFTEITVCTPFVSSIDCLCLDVNKTYKVTVDDESFTGIFEEVVMFLDSKGLYAYPSENECGPCKQTITQVGFDIDYFSDNPEEDEFNIDVIVDDVFYKTLNINTQFFGKVLWMEILSQIPNISYRTFRGDGYYDYYPKIYFMNETESKIRITLNYPENVSFALMDTPLIDGSDIINVGTISTEFCITPFEDFSCGVVSVYETVLSNTPYLPEETEVTINGVIHYLKDLHQNLGPATINDNGYGLEIKNNTKECIIINIDLSLTSNDNYIPFKEISPNNSSVFVDVFSSSINLKLSPVVHTLPNVSATLLDKNGASLPGYDLQQENEYEVLVQVSDYNNPNPSWTGVLLFQGNSYNLVVGSSFQIPVILPQNNTWEDVDIHLQTIVESAFEYESSLLNTTYTVRFNRNLIPSSAVQRKVERNSSFFWEDSITDNSEQISYVQELPSGNFLDGRSGQLSLKFHSAYVGLTLEVSGISYTISSDEMTVPYNEPYYDVYSEPKTISKATLLIKNKIGQVVTELKLPIVTHQMVLYDTSDIYQQNNERFSLSLGSSYAFALKAISPSVKKVSLYWAGNKDAPYGGSSFFETNTSYSVVNGVLTLPSKALSQTFNPVVSGGYLAYHVVALITEATDASLIGRTIITKTIYWEIK